MSDNDEESIKQFINRLIRRGKVMYEVFDLVEEQGFDASRAQRIRASLIEIIEVHERQQLKQAAAILDTSRDILKRKEPSVELEFRTWADCMLAAEPDHKATQVLCSQFTSILATLPQQLETQYLKLVPLLVKTYKGSTVKIAPAVADNLKKLHSDELYIKYIAFLERYITSISDQGFQGLLPLGLVLVRLGDARLLADFEEQCSPKRLHQTEHAERFIVSLGEAIHRVSSETQSRYIALCLMAASQSFGSAASVASDLPRRLTHISAALRERYVDSFVRILSKVGICAVGFCLDRLPQLLSTRPSSDVQRQVDMVCKIASEYGPTAAEEYMVQIETHLQRQLYLWRVRFHSREFILCVLVVVLALLVTGFLLLVKLV